MKKISLLFFTASFFIAASVANSAEKETEKMPSNSSSSASDPLGWPQITRDAKPWTRWWWMGDAVDAANLTRELERYQKAGLGGVEVTPIYGVKGYENRFIEYLSPKWMEMLRHTITTAQNLDMGVDMPTCSGWCFGGPNVSDDDANASVVVKTFDVSSWQFVEKFDREKTQALVAFSPDGKSIDLTKNIAADGSVSFPQNSAAQGGTWHVLSVSQKPSGVKVKRPAPGGEGWMLNLLYPDAMDRYLQRFNAALNNSGAANAPKLNSMFHDSYEYKSDWSPDFFAQFEKRRGYKLQTELPAFFENKGDADHIARVKSDYRETVSELIEESISRWTKWSHDHGYKSRNQAHGSPGNWLDIYAASDIPETEMFYKDRDILVSKFASSAAHVTGNNLVGAETGTWVAEHFTETLADLKWLIDDMFLAGVNRVTWHGTAFSPDDAPWPGWCFYASTEMNPRNSIWRDVPALNAYAARVQSILQSGRPDNDILLYWPIHDFWHNDKGRERQFTIHARDWFYDQPIGKTARMLWQRGFAFDYVSDELLKNAKFENGALDLYGNKYRAIVVPECEHMPLQTFKQLLTLVNSGATVIFENHLPTDVSGFSDLEKQRAEFQQLVKQNNAQQNRALLIGDVEKSLAQKGIAREPMVDHEGLHFVRRAIDGKRVYFIANRGEKRIDDRIALVALASKARAVELINPIGSAAQPMTGRFGFDLPSGENGAREIRLQLEPGESLILREMDGVPDNLVAWKRWLPAGDAVELRGAWKVKFIEGGPVLPKEFSTEKLASWTESGDEEAQRFAGAARYSLSFDAPPGWKAGDMETRWLLDLGKVCESARARLNGEELGTLFTPPFRVRIPGFSLKAKDNVLEVEVTNTSANRIRDLDRRKVPWKIFGDINIVNLSYKPFDASNWPLADSGLLGPVTLQAQKEVTPKQ